MFSLFEYFTKPSALVLDQKKTPVVEELDADWEVLTEQVPEGDKINFQIVDSVPIGFVSLITKRQLLEFLKMHQNALFCFWQQGSEFRGAIRCLLGSPPLPNYIRLDRLFAKAKQEEELLQVLNEELDRLRQIEMRFPYSVSLELESPLLKGLLTWVPFVHYMWNEIVVNPWADFTILYPFERLYMKQGQHCDWQDTLDCVKQNLAKRNVTYPKLFVNLLGPRNTVFSSNTDLKICEKLAHSFSADNPQIVNSSYFVCFPLSDQDDTGNL